MIRAFEKNSNCVSIILRQLIVRNGNRADSWVTNWITSDCGLQDEDHSDHHTRDHTFIWFGSQQSQLIVFSCF